jgi:hypothetical protein
MIPGFLAPQGPNFFFAKTLTSIFPPSCSLVAVMFTAVAPLIVVTSKILVTGTKFSETSMVGPLGVLLAGPVAATIGVGDVDDGPPGGCWWQVRQWPPPELETSMVGPWGGGDGDRSGSGHHRS